MIAQWHDFFVMVGGSAAALTGLVFVAMSINLETIAKEITHRNRAIGTVVGFTAVFMICSFALMGGQNSQIVGYEWFVVSSLAAAIFFGGIIRAKRRGRSLLDLGFYRLIFGTTLYLAEIIGTILLI